MTTQIDILEGIARIAGDRQRTLVFVCGFGGSGKTTLCKELSSLMATKAVVFETDWYSKYATNERRERIAEALASGDSSRIEREENPFNWYDWDNLRQDLQALMSAGSVKITSGWSQKTGLKELTLNLELPRDEPAVVLCDGIYLLHPEMLSLAHLIVLLDTPIASVIERTYQRDAHRSTPEYLAYKTSLLRKYDEPYFERFRMNAHMIVAGSFN